MSESRKFNDIQAMLQLTGKRPRAQLGVFDDEEVLGDKGKEEEVSEEYEYLFDDASALHRIRELEVAEAEAGKKRKATRKEKKAKREAKAGADGKKAGRKPREATSAVHAAYERVGEPVSRKVKCRLCGKIRTADKSGTTNLLNHLLEKHNEIWGAMKDAAGKTGVPGAELALTTILEAQKKKQPMLFEGLKARSHRAPGKFRKELRLALWVAFSNVPLHKLDNDYWRRFEAELGVSLARRQTLAKMLPAVAQYCESHVVSLIKGAGTGTVSIAADMWTSLAKSHYLAITYHWLTSNWDIQSQVLDLIEWNGPACGSVIATVIEERFDARFPNQDVSIASFTSDRGANVLLARDTLAPDDSEDCIPHLLKAALDDVTKQAATVPNSTFYSSQASTDEACLTSLVTLVRSSYKTRDALKAALPGAIDHLNAIQGNVTRWEGRYSMLKRSLKLRRGYDTMYERSEALLALIASTNGPKDMLSNSFWERIRGLYLIYKIFNQLSKRAQEVKSVTKPKVLGWIAVVIDDLEALQVVEAVAKARICFKRSFEHRFLPLTLAVNNTTKAAVLDPRNNGNRFLTPNMRARCWEKIKEEALQLAGEEDDEEGAEMTKRMIKVASEFAIAKIAASTEDVIQFWRALNVGKVGLLLPAVRSILAVPAGAAEPERVFSHTTWVVTKHTQSLSSETIENTVVIRKALQNGFVDFEDLLAWIDGKLNE